MSPTHMHDKQIYTSTKATMIQIYPLAKLIPASNRPALQATNIFHVIKWYS